MKRLLFLALAAGLLVYVLSPQWRSFDRMGERRSNLLSGTPKEIVVGVCWPFEVNQDGMADGLRMAQDEINTGGLAGGVPIRLIVRDDDFDSDKARRIAVEFANTPEMSAVLGYYDDSVAIEASSIYEPSRLLHLIVGANNTSMTAHGYQYLVRTIVSSDKIARALARLSIERGHKRIALIWEEDAYGEDLAYQYHVALNALNGELVYQWSYSRERADFRLPANELKGIDADAILFMGLEPWAGDFLRVARGVGIKTNIVGAFSNTPEMRARAGKAMEGAMYYEEYSASSTSPENKEFVRKFHARYGRRPDAWAAQGYDALHILARAVRATRSANPLDLCYAIRFMDAWEGVNGRYKFDGRGELEDKPIYLNEIQNGMPVTLGHSTPEFAPLLH